MEYIMSKEMKCTFVLNVMLFITGMVFGKDIVIAASVIIFAILSIAVQILEAIYKVGNKSN